MNILAYYMIECNVWHTFHVTENKLLLSGTAWQTIAFFISLNVIFWAGITCTLYRYDISYGAAPTIILKINETNRESEKVKQSRMSKYLLQYPQMYELY